MINYVILFFVALISATIFPLGSEALLILNIENKLNIYILVLVATIGNTIGSIINYYLGLKGEKFLIKKNILNKNSIKNSKKYFDRYGGYSLFLSWMPIIGDPITFLAGVLKYNLKKFIFLVLIAKFGRYLFITIIYIQIL